MYGDFNNDGMTDFVATSNGGNSLVTYINKNGSFQQTSFITGIDSPPWMIRSYDVNGDGNLDIIVSFPETNAIGIYTNNGLGQFTRTKQLIVRTSQGILRSSMLIMIHPWN